jgi:hypothetical protein
VIRKLRGSDHTEWSCWDVNNEITWWFGIDIDSYPTRKETEYETTNQAVVGWFLFRSKALQHRNETVMKRHGGSHNMGINGIRPNQYGLTVAAPANGPMP